MKDKRSTRPGGRITKPAAQPKAEDDEAFSMTTSTAAKGLSSFYGKVKEHLLNKNVADGDGFVLHVKPSPFSLDEQLERRGNMVTPGNPKFTGKAVERHFQVGDTIRSKLGAAAKDEGLELIWDLDRDYKIKYYFNVETNFLRTLSTVASALDSDFEKEVRAYYCYKQRAAIITHEATAFIKSNCQRATNKS